MACMIQEAGAMEAFSSTRTFLYLVHHYKPLVRPIHTPTTTTATTTTTTTTTISREDGDGDDDNDNDADKEDFLSLRTTACDCLVHGTHKSLNHSRHGVCVG